MKLALLAASAVALAAFSAAPVSAAVFDFSYTGPGIAASGALTTTDTPDGNGYYTVTALNGVRNGQPMVLLAPGSYPADGPNDNLVKAGADYFDFFGLGFSTDQDYNVFEFSPGSYVECYSTCGDGDPNEVFLTSISVTEVSVPEPATWALMLVGFGGMGAAMRMTRRKAVAITA